MHVRAKIGDCGRTLGMGAPLLSFVLGASQQPDSVPIGKMCKGLKWKKGYYVFPCSLVLLVKSRISLVRKLWFSPVAV